MIYFNYDVHLRAIVRFTVIRLITEVAVHRCWKDCSKDFGKFLGKQRRWSPILVQLQALQFY